jgi:hypothetical protein
MVSTKPAVRRLLTRRVGDALSMAFGAPGSTTRCFLKLDPPGSSSDWIPGRIGKETRQTVRVCPTNQSGDS